MKQITAITGLLLVGILDAPIAAALPISYDESVSGDLQDPRYGCCYQRWNDQTSFTVDIGANQILGSYEFALLPDYSFINDVDPFRIIVPYGLRVDRVRFFYEITGVHNFDDFAYRFQLLDYDAGVFRALDHIILVSSGVFPPVDVPFVTLFEAATWNEYLYPGLMPLGPGTWNFYPSHASSRNATSELYSYLTMNYRVVLDVHRVPEPGTLALLGLGLAGLGFARRRKLH